MVRGPSQAETVIKTIIRKITQVTFDCILFGPIIHDFRDAKKKVRHFQRPWLVSWSNQSCWTHQQIFPWTELSLKKMSTGKLSNMTSIQHMFLGLLTFVPPV